MSTPRSPLRPEGAHHGAFGQMINNFARDSALAGERKNLRNYRQNSGGISAGRGRIVHRRCHATAAIRAPARAMTELADPLATVMGTAQVAAVGCRQSGAILEPGLWQRISLK